MHYFAGTSTEEIEGAFISLARREDIGILAINSDVKFMADPYGARTIQKLYIVRSQDF